MKHRRTIAAVLAIAGLACIAAGQWGVRVDAVLPVPADQLGLAPDHASLAAPVAAQMPTFFVVGGGDQENERKNVRLWEFAKLATGGKHIRNFAQETGDCVSQGTRNAAEYYNAAAIGKGLLDSEYHEVFPPYTYGGSRVTIGKGRLGRSPGSVGAWAAEFTQRFGVLRADADGVPAYSGRVADEWGVKGPPQEFIAASKMFTFDTIAPITKAADARDAICNGYPVTIASDFGTKTIKVKDGRRVAIRNARWPHQMCLVGYDGSASEPYFYVINSWGESAHPAPMQDEPPGGFWITFSDCEYIVRQGDSFAYSGFDGFPANEFVPDFSVIGAAGPPAAPQAIQETEAMFPLSPDLTMPLTIIGGVLLALAVVLLLRGNRRGRTVAGAVALMLALPAIVPAQEFRPDFATLTNSATISTSGSRTASDPSTASAAEFAPDFALLAMKANAPTDIGGIRASVQTEPPAVDFATLSRAACDACTCKDCLCAECDGKTCSAVVAAKPLIVRAHTAAWCSTCPLWKRTLGNGNADCRIEWTDKPPPAGAKMLPALVAPDGRIWDWSRQPTVDSLAKWAATPVKQTAMKTPRMEYRPVGRGGYAMPVLVE